MCGCGLGTAHKILNTYLLVYGISWYDPTALPDGCHVASTPWARLLRPGSITLALPTPARHHARRPARPVGDDALHAQPPRRLQLRLAVGHPHRKGLGMRAARRHQVRVEQLDAHAPPARGRKSEGGESGDHDAAAFSALWPGSVGRCGLALWARAHTHPSYSAASASKADRSACGRPALSRRAPTSRSSPKMGTRVFAARCAARCAAAPARPSATTPWLARCRGEGEARSRRPSGRRRRRAGRRAQSARLLRTGPPASPATRDACGT